MNIEEKVKNELVDLEKLKSTVSDIVRNVSSYFFPQLIGKIGEQIINFINKFTKEKVSKFSEEDFSSLDALQAHIQEFIQITSELARENCFENMVINHGDDAFYYPGKLYDVRDRCQNISDQIHKKYGDQFLFSFQNADFDVFQSHDYKQLVKHLKSCLKGDADNLNIKNMMETIMKNNLYFTKKENENIKKSLEEIDSRIEDNEIEFAENSNLGSGGFGTVMKGTYLKTSEEVAIKNIRIDRISENSIYSFLIEIKTMHQAQHPNLLRFVGAGDKYPYPIITRYCSGKSLFERLHYKSQDFPALTPMDLTKIAYQVALGMEYLHGKQIVHRDLKTSNILLDDYNNAYVADFGLSGHIDNEKKLFGGVGTPNYTAPEILARIHYNDKVDVYSYSIVLWEMLTQHIPFKDLQPDKIYDHVVRNNWRLPIPQDSPQGLRKLIIQSWSKNPKERPTFSEIVQMFRDLSISFPQEGADEKGKSGQEVAIDFNSIEKDLHCPRINEEYLMNVLHKKRPQFFDSVVEFIVKNMDNNLREKLRNASILDELIQKPNECYSSTLLLASSLLDESEFSGFLDDGGQEMFMNALSNHSRQSLSGALTFATKLPIDLIPKIKESIESVVNLLGENDPTPDGIILQLLTRFNESQLKLNEYIPKITNFLLNIQLIHIDSQKMFDSFITLFLLCSRETVDGTLRKKHFLEFITPKFIIKDLRFADKIITMFADIDCPNLIKHLIRSLKTSELTDKIISLVTNINKTKPEVFDELAKDSEFLIDIKNCIKEIMKQSSKYKAPLLLLFCIVSRKKSPTCFINLSKESDVISSLFEMNKYVNQRLQIFTALVKSEAFCSEAPDSTMENIFHLISSSPTPKGQYLSTIALKLILAMSEHKEGCKILQKHDILDLFVQNFLSSNTDLNISYRIIRNVAKKGVDEIPQYKIIISCLLQSLLYEVAQKETILDTLVALVKKFPNCIQEKDLQDYILFKIEAPVVALQSLRLLKALELNRLSPGTIDNILTHVYQTLEKPNYHHPKIINAGLAIIKNLIGKINIQNFLEQTDIKNFANGFLDKLEKDFPNSNEKTQNCYKKIIPQVKEFLQLCDNYNKPTNIILEQEIDN